MRNALFFVLLVVLAPATATSASTRYSFTGPFAEAPQIRQTIGAGGVPVDYCVAPLSIAIPQYEQWVVFTGTLVSACNDHPTAGGCFKVVGGALAGCIDFTGHIQVCLVAQEYKLSTSC